MGTVIGYVLFVIAAGWIAYKMNVSYNSAGGTAFAVPVYDAAIYPPILTAVGLYLVLPSFGVEWPVWAYIAIGVALVPVIVGGIKLMEEVGDREL
jgi:ABC-type spermidine/putrescine transport system permease subunit II